MKSYSLDLRVRLLSSLLSRSIRETAKLFNVSPNTVYLLKKQFTETGSLEPRERKRKASRLMTPEGELYLQLLLSENADLTLEELRDRYEKTYGVRVSIGTLFNTLKKLNITRKKKTFSDPKKKTDEVKRKKENYDRQLENIEPEKRLYLDETGTCLNMSPAYGRSQRGRPAYDEKPTSPGDTVSTVVILAEDGIKAQYTYSTTLNAVLFMAYLDLYVLPILKEGQVLIMDNHPVHHAKIVSEYLHKNNVKFLYLPPYSPELNPIEEAFSKVKYYIKKHKPRTLDRLLATINKAFETITANDICGYFNHAAQF